MQPPLRQLSKALSDGIIHSGNDKVRQLPPEQQAQVLELSYDYVTYLRANKGDWPEASAISKELLLARSELSVPAATPEVDIPKTRPDQGHKSFRMGLGIGNRDGVSYEELTIRPAYHDQNDPGAGYIQGAQIQFFNLALRHYGDGVGSRVEELMPIDVFSLSPRNDFFQSLSWKVNFGWSRKHMADGSEPLLAGLNSGVGLAWDVSTSYQRTSLTYVFMDATLENSGHYARDYALGVGPAAGVITDVSNNWRVNAYARVQRFGLGEPHTVIDFTVLQRYSIGPQSAVRLELTRKTEFDTVWSDIKFSVQQYF